ncbi:MAG: hypothetical protein AMS17_09180 [Spirochaetes bacterium DG_61]|nr:MAG: hypothetical protein AMS17_09180 [Spirochaetes bacterium DG_61]
MGYDEEIDARIRTIINKWENTASKKMFGGVCHLLNGNMFCGVYKNFLILRLGVQGSEEALGRPYVKSMDITGKPIKGWVMVQKQGIVNDEELAAWLERAKKYTRTLPPK